MIIKIAAIALCSVMLYVLLKNHRPEFAPIAEVVGVVVIFVAVLPEVKQIKDSFDGMLDAAGVASQFFTILIKVLGIALVSQFASDMSRDSGQTALASKIEFAGRVLMVCMSLPIIKSITQLIAEMVENV